MTKLVNKHCGTSFDPSEVAWWRLGFEQRMDEERRELFTRFRNAMAITLDEKRRREPQASQATVVTQRQHLTAQAT
ncbi:hypothetical protein ACH4CC_34995 [Streptomyces lydicus]|uniref:hypothetical protein n=1 Tax=Streptomyces lydicus TaxID=47763 RepID=UPI0037A21D52